MIRMRSKDKLADQQLADQLADKPADTVFFETVDLHLADFLLTKKIPFRGSYTKGDVSVLRFKNDPRIADLIDDFHFGGEAPAKDLLNNHRFLSAEIKRNRRSGVEGRAK